LFTDALPGAGWFVAVVDALLPVGVAVEVVVEADVVVFVLVVPSTLSIALLVAWVTLSFALFCTLFFYIIQDVS
jgi:hypothetical protein